VQIAEMRTTNRAWNKDREFL